LPSAVHDIVAKLEGHTAVVPVYDGRYVHGRLVGIALTSTRDSVAYVPVDDPRLRALVPFLQDPARPKIVHDAKELFVLLMRLGVTLRGVAFDTRLASFLIDPNKLIAEHHRIESVAKEYVQRVIPLRKDLTNPNVAPRQKATIGEKPLAELDVAVVAKYAAELARAVYDLHAPLVDRLKDAGNAEKLLFDLELPLSWVLGQMEMDGIGVDAGEMKKIGEELAGRLVAIEEHIHELAGKEFNIGSPKQLGEILFEHLKLPVLKRTKSGYSTDAEVLERLAPKHEICAQVVEYRRIDKLINTYTDVLQREVHPKTGRVHANFQQTVGVSGRIITMDPDLQRTPVKTEEGVRIRQAFVARPLKDGTKTMLIDVDWSQIELRLLAHFANDPVLVESYHKGVDIHRRTAAEILGKKPEDITKQERDIGKTVNFSTIYGQGALALGRIIGVSTKEADGYIERYFALYAGVHRWKDEAIKIADERGWAETILGRRRIIPELHSRSPMDRGFGERVAVNTPIQGSAADICKLAMLSIDKRLRKEAPRTKMLLQVHDELVLEAPIDEVETASKIVKECMENVVELRVPLIAEVGVGPSWGDAK
jgi:DNA polymerase I